MFSLSSTNSLIRSSSFFFSSSYCLISFSFKVGVSGCPQRGHLSPLILFKLLILSSISLILACLVFISASMLLYNSRCVSFFSFNSLTMSLSFSRTLSSERRCSIYFEAISLTLSSSIFILFSFSSSSVLSLLYSSILSLSIFNDSSRALILAVVSRYSLTFSSIPASLAMSSSSCFRFSSNISSILPKALSLLRASTPSSTIASFLYFSSTCFNLLAASSASFTSLSSRSFSFLNHSISLLRIFALLFSSLALSLFSSRTLSFSWSFSNFSANFMDSVFFSTSCFSSVSFLSNALLSSSSRYFARLASWDTVMWSDFHSFIMSFIFS